MAVHPQARAAFDEAGAAFTRGALAQAIALYDAALRLAPDWLDAQHNRALALQQHGDLEAALAAIAAALTLDDRRGDLHHLHGSILQSLERWEAALAAYQQAIALNPALAHSHNNSATIYRTQERYAEAIAACQQALALQPHFMDAMQNLANALSESGRHAEALAMLQALRAAMPQALALQRDHAAALYRAGEVEASLAAYRAVVARTPEDAESLTSIGSILQSRGEVTAALAAMEQSVRVQPHSGLAQFNLAVLRLLMGDFTEGWRGYEARWHKPDMRGKRDFSVPLWLGEALAPGARLLLHAEQGLGDTLQFCRYVPLLQVAHPQVKIWLEVPETLRSLLQRNFPQITLLSRGDALPEVDWHCPLMSLPLAFGTTLETIPAAPAYLHADPARVAQWQATLGEATARRVGLVCSGAAQHKNDANRSIPLSHFAALLASGAEIHLLQKELRPADAAFQAAHPHLTFHGDQLLSMEDTAALVMAMDLVVSVDTSLAHLAAALGKPVRLLLPYAPDFRWMLTRNDSPWYPTMRLYRQPVAGDWASVLQRVMDEL